ncbi:MAG TPA: potassium channel family protein [Ktedonobacteraceae bacterium]|nr:potassium channel family protein [Ktedonobacteraceae bacterium]
MLMERTIAVLAGLCAILLISFVLWDVFEVIILPRRVSRRLRLTVLIYLITWKPWSAIARRMHNAGRREVFLSFYGPLSLILLLVVWMVGLIVGYALLQWSLGSAVSGIGEASGFPTDLYMSGTTFITLGLGDVIPRTGLARLVTVIEAATGFGLLAVVIGYLPVLYQAFSRREADITLLDARAGSPPSAVEMLRRYAQDRDINGLNTFLREWERWGADLLESHLSYPTLAYFRSQHDNQSWLAALTVILDVCALVLVGIDDLPTHQARLTFAIARHAAVDLSQVLNLPPPQYETRLTRTYNLAKIRKLLKEAGIPMREGEVAAEQLSKMRGMYESYVNTLSDRLLMPLPPWIPPEDSQDDWLSTA